MKIIKGKPSPAIKKIVDSLTPEIMDEARKELGQEPVSEDLEEAVNAYIGYAPDIDEDSSVYGKRQAFKAGAKWKEKEMQSTIELAEDHAYFAGRTKTIDEIKEALLSEVLPCFMHGGEADEVVAKLDEVLNQKK